MIYGNLIKIGTLNLNINQNTSFYYFQIINDLYWQFESIFNLVKYMWLHLKQQSMLACQPIYHASKFPVRDVNRCPGHYFEGKKASYFLDNILTL